MLEGIFDQKEFLRSDPLEIEVGGRECKQVGGSDEFVQESGRLTTGHLGLFRLACLENNEYQNRYYPPEIKGLSDVVSEPTLYINSHSFSPQPPSSFINLQNQERA
jgi:hypothetical protein